MTKATTEALMRAEKEREERIKAQKRANAFSDLSDRYRRERDVARDSVKLRDQKLCRLTRELRNSRNREQRLRYRVEQLEERVEGAARIPFKLTELHAWYLENYTVDEIVDAAARVEALQHWLDDEASRPARRTRSRRIEEAV